MKFDIAFKINNRWGKYSRYSLVEFCVCIVDRWSLKEREVEDVIRLRVNDFTEVGGERSNEAIKVRRAK